jgi:DNA-binding transcriptional MerR regulator/effector-binding domain-containing protein
MFRIGDFSRLARVTIRTLHHYDEAGLLTPAHVDRDTGYRYYAAAQLETLQRILLLKDLGFTLEDIRALLAADADASALERRLVARREELLGAIEADHARLRRLDALRTALSNGDVPAVTLREVAAVDVHARRERVADLGVDVQRMFEAAEAAVAAARARADASPFLVFHDPEYREHDADVEVCIPVKADAAARIDVRAAPAITAGCVTYRGPYVQTPLLYGSLLRWIERSGLGLAGPLREVYHRFGADQNGYRLPSHVLAATSADYVTELQAPVAPLAHRTGD